jgi:N-acetylmuramoyl-L-alanine amidase
MIKTAIRIVLKRGICLFLVSGFIISNSDSQYETVNGYKLKTVVIDAGHGGKDPGSVGKTGTEKEVVLAIALKLGQYIETWLPDVKVVYTRKTDEFIPLHQRADIANAHKADLFISIHANGNTNSLVMGTETLVLGLHRAGENFEVAKKENSVILLEDDYTSHYEGFDPNSPESYIIFSLMQNLYFEQSINFAANVQDQFRDRATRKDRGVKQQGLLVLARTSMPGVLVETGFVTNPEEEIYLLSEPGQEYIASAIFRAFRDYKNMMETKHSYIAGTIQDNDSNKSRGPSDSLAYIDLLTAPVRDTNNEVIVKPAIVEVNNPVVFKVQILASVKKISQHDALFKGHSDVQEYRVGKMYKYVIGGSTSCKEMIDYSRKIQNLFPGAFVIATKDSSIIPLDQALKETDHSTKNK